MNSEIIPDIIILFGGIFSFILFAGQTVLKKRNINNIILSFLFLFTGIFQISNSYSLFSGSDKWFQVYNLLFPIGIISFFFIGPLQYIYFMGIINFDIKINNYFLIHFIPGIISGIFLFSFKIDPPKNVISVNEYRGYIIENYYIYKIIVLLSVLLFLIYSVLFLKYLITLHLQKHTTRKNILRVTIYFISILIFIVLMWPLQILFGINNVKVIHVLLTVYIVSIYILSNRYPQFIHIIKLEAERDSYIRSQTVGLDIKFILDQLFNIMNDQKLYCNENLTIKMLASELDITSHQLSEILNQHIGKNFYNYINEMRIEEAKRMLSDEIDQSIISITYAVGYNSTSAFYNAFKRYTGMSPSVYRKTNLKK